MVLHGGLCGRVERCQVSKRSKFNLDLFLLYKLNCNSKSSYYFILIKVIIK